MKNLKISTVNFKAIWGNKEENIKKMIKFIKKAVKEESNMIIFPELALTGYDNIENIQYVNKMHIKEAESILDKTSQLFLNMAIENNIYIIFGMPEKDLKDASIVYNSAIICCPDKRLFSYRKIHLPFDEADWATSGEKPLVFDTEFGKIGLSICYDTYCFPELQRYAKASGANIFINITACGEEVFKNVPLSLQLETSALTNGMYIVSSALCGSGPVHNFVGGTSIIGISKNSKKNVEYYTGSKFGFNLSEKIYTAELDLKFIENQLVTPIFKKNSRLNRPDFRPNIYEKMYKELSENIKYKNN